MELIGEAPAILGDEDRVYGLVRDELLELVETHGDERRTEFQHFGGDIDIEDTIAGSRW